MGPLSGKQHREYLKFQNKEAREAAKMELDEARKQQLHEIKLQEAAAKANQGLGHKEQVNNAKPVMLFAVLLSDTVLLLEDAPSTPLSPLLPPSEVFVLSDRGATYLFV